MDEAGLDIVNWGTIEFNDAWRRQRELADAILMKGANDTLVLCEHPDVITLGRLSKEGSVVTDSAVLNHRGVQVVEIDRGGEATVHNPGQLVGYPIFHLERSKPDLHWFLRTIEECIIEAIAEFGVVGGRVEGRTGVWVDADRKICAIGIHCRKWVTTHGFALNVSNDLSLFNDIIPCGIQDKGVTSISVECGRPIELTEVRTAVAAAFTRAFAPFHQNATSVNR
jgi:lipoate-protein ligase B